MRIITGTHKGRTNMRETQNTQTDEETQQDEADHKIYKNEHHAMTKWNGMKQNMKRNDNTKQHTHAHTTHANNLITIRKGNDNDDIYQYESSRKKRLKRKKGNDEHTEATSTTRCNRKKKTTHKKHAKKTTHDTTMQ